jgi:hypothetical protein
MRTEGVSAAFIEELMRRTAQAAVSRGEDGEGGGGIDRARSSGGARRHAVQRRGVECEVVGWGSLTTSRGDRQLTREEVRIVASRLGTDL